MPFMNISRSLILVVRADLIRLLICELSATLSRIAERYSFLSIRLQSTHRFSDRLSIISSQMRVLRPLPSINGCATFISTYLSIISSNVVSGILSMSKSVSGKCIQLAKVNPPFDIFLVRFCPAKSYSPRKYKRVSVADTLRCPAPVAVTDRFHKADKLSSGFARPMYCHYM